MTERSRRIRPDRKSKDVVEAERRIGEAAMGQIVRAKLTLLDWPEYRDAAASAPLDQESVEAGAISFERDGERYVISSSGSVTKYYGDAVGINFELIVGKRDSTLVLGYSGIRRDKRIVVENGQAALFTGGEFLTGFDAIEASGSDFSELFPQDSKSGQITPEAQPTS